MLGIVVVNHNTSMLTIECLHSVQQAEGVDDYSTIVVDSGSEPAQLHALREGLSTLGSRFELQPIPDNVGFAAACNRAIERLLANPVVEQILLLNNDAVLEPGGLHTLLAFAREQVDAVMVGGRMHQFAAPDQVDSLGIAFYASVLASNRKTTRYRLLGPSGGLGLYSRQLLETLQDKQGYVFDERFFCYAEDTDLAFRALLLGYKPAYCDQLIALHHGQASSGGGFNDFVLYHGIRNSIWTASKCMPWPMLLVMSPLALVLHAAIIVRHLQRGKARVLWRLYRDALQGLPAMLRARRAIQRHRVITSWQMWQYVTPRFYDREYLRQAWRDLWQKRG